MHDTWESDVAGFLNELLAVQEGLLGVLVRKRDLLAAGEVESLATVTPEEEQFVESLRQCVRRREDLLAIAAEEGLPSESIKALAAALPREGRRRLDEPLVRAASQASLLRHHSLTHWVVVQRTLLHLSHLLEIIATGGQPQPTYGRGKPPESSGALVDRAA